jgi:hypothetical protein
MDSCNILHLAEATGYHLVLQFNLTFFLCLLSSYQYYISRKLIGSNLISVIYNLTRSHLNTVTAFFNSSQDLHLLQPLTLETSLKKFMNIKLII